MTRLIRGNGLARLLQTRFGAGKGFVEAYLRYFERSQNVTLATEGDWNALSETQRMWFDYALSTNGRGEDLMRFLETRRGLRGRRYLDVGCGFGGHLVAASRHGASVLGIEIDRERIGFSRANLADFGVAGPVHELDALSGDIVERLGTFDVITCNDVAEHVESAERLIGNLARLLRPGGLACLEIPNGDCIDFVKRDGHFGLFGITLLDRARAMEYHREHFQFPYDVGDYWKLEDYGRFFERAGLRWELAESLYHPTRGMEELGEQLRQLEAGRVRHPMLDGEYEAYRARVERDRGELGEEAFRERYLRNFWMFLAWKGA